LSLTPPELDRFRSALRAVGLAQGFSIALSPQFISGAMLAQIEGFIRVFDRVTGREAWRAAALREAPAIAHASGARSASSAPGISISRPKADFSSSASCSPRSSMRSITKRPSSGWRIR
jgi:hypothetical protein